MTKNRIFTFHCKSGNSCEVIIGAKGFEIGGVNHINPPMGCLSTLPRGSGGVGEGLLA